jgi:hypothetical protein
MNEDFNTWTDDELWDAVKLILYVCNPRQTKEVVDEYWKDRRNTGSRKEAIAWVKRDYRFIDEHYVNYYAQ